MAWLEKIDMILHYQDGSTISKPNIPFWGLRYRHEKKYVGNHKRRPIRISIQGTFSLDLERMEWLLKYENQVLHPILSKGIWVNGVKLSNK